MQTSLEWFTFSLFALIIFAIIDNSGTQSISNIQNQIAIITCPLPLFGGTDYLNGTISYTVPNTGTFYECYKDPLSDNITTIAHYDHNYNETAFSVIPYGFFHYIGDTLGSVGSKVLAFFTLVTYLLTPINIDLLGYGLGDISGTILVIVIGLFVFIYLGIAQYTFGVLIGAIKAIF